MSIAKQEMELFEEWSKSREYFVTDGVVSETDYSASKLKLCFVLKEVNDLHGGGWDLREFLRGGGRPASAEQQEVGELEGPIGRGQLCAHLAALRRRQLEHVQRRRKSRARRGGGGGQRQRGGGGLRHQKTEQHAAGPPCA